MRSFLAATVTVLIAGAACGQFKVQQTTTSTAGVQSATVASSTESLDDAKRIQRDAAIKMVKEGTAVWIDVRPVVEFAAGHIPGAINIPLTELPTRFKDLPVKKYLITYCAWQTEHTSARAVLDMKAHGIKNAAALLGGWTAWKEAGLPVQMPPVKASVKAPVKK